MFKFRSMKTRFIVSFVSISLCTTLVPAGAFSYHLFRDYEKQVAIYREDLVHDKDTMLKEKTQVAVSAVNEIYKKQLSGIMTEAQAKKEAADLVRNLRYDDGRGYFWIDTYEGVNVVLLGNPVEGHSRLNEQDPSGRYFIREMLSKGRSEGGGYTDLSFPKPGETESLPKRNYTMSFEPYHWVIGTGVWIDEIDTMVQARRNAMEQLFQATICSMIIGSFLLQLLFVFIATRLGHAVSSPMEIVTKRMVAMGSGYLHLDDETMHELQKFMSREDEVGKLTRAMRDMHSKLFDYQKAVLEMARKDALTGLANRRYMHEYIRTRCKPELLTLITLDLDHFKEVNDTYGHQTGDAALLILSEVMKSVFKDAFHVRLGGDEFMVVLSRGEPMIEIEEKICDFMEQLIAVYKTDPGLECLTVSAGVSHANGELMPLDVLMQQSDAALYAAKLAGRSCYRIYQPGLELEVEAKD